MVNLFELALPTRRHKACLKFSQKRFIRQDKRSFAAGKRRNKAKSTTITQGNKKERGHLRMERKLRYAWWIVLIGLMILAIWKLFLPHGSNAYLQKTVSSREIVVYVAGAVEKPGLVHLAPDARLDDALKQAHPLVEANLDSMNPAEKLKDGQKISVPYKTTLPSLGSTVAGNNASLTIGTGNGATNVGSVPSGIASSTSTSGKININTAGVAELDKLPGVGPALAERIIQYRTEHGLFARAEDLENVSGIGAKTYEKMAAQVTVSP